MNLRRVGGFIDIGGERGTKSGDADSACLVYRGLRGKKMERSVGSLDQYTVA